MEKTVTGCSDCPFSIEFANYKAYGNSKKYGKCQHPKTGCNAIIILEDKWLPNWCPLKQESITIKLKE